MLNRLDREVFKLLSVPDVTPRFNLAPTQQALAIREPGDGGGRSLIPLRWGLIPSWARDPAIGNRLINARAETLAAKPAFKAAFQRRRCLVPADGFYEWQKVGRGKQPWFLRLKDGGVFAFAGLWERWSDSAHGAVESFTIITTTPNELLEPIHNRMPVILPPERYDQWLDPAGCDMDRLAALLRPYPAGAMTAYSVSTYVNSPAHEGPECVRPLEP